jgi:hypothetical protein
VLSGQEKLREGEEKVLSRQEKLREGPYETLLVPACQRSASRDPLRPEFFSLKGPPALQRHGTPARGA